MSAALVEIKSLVHFLDVSTPDCWTMCAFVLAVFSEHTITEDS